MTMSSKYSYVLITPARNEEACIENTILSVMSQTITPLKWVVVSDGSTDGTDDIIKRYAAQLPWLEFVRVSNERERHFAAKVECFNAGYARVIGLSYNFIGNLDADVTFDKEYYEVLLGKFYEFKELGVAGTPFVEGRKQVYDYGYTNIEHVSGLSQLFRRECFEEIGGYKPIKGGGIDWVAVTTARMKGWKTRTFTDKVCYHHRRIGTASSGELGAWFKRGGKDYYLGNHPLWELFRAAYQMTKRPFGIAGAALFFGYVWGMVSRIERPVSTELIAFIRHEQMDRLGQLLRKAMALRGS
jgi:glycosyltransferase involved in cell wall biosynthesis